MDGFEVIGLRLDLIIVPLVTVVLLAVGVPLAVLGATKWRDKYIDMWHGAGVVGLIIAILGGIAGLVWVVLLAPFQSQYHHWYSANGEVTSVTNVFEGGSGEMSPGYVVEVDSVEQPLLFTDPRVLRSQGEHLTITCSLEWVPSGADRLNCWIAG